MKKLFMIILLLLISCATVQPLTTYPILDSFARTCVTFCGNREQMLKVFNYSRGNGTSKAMCKCIDGNSILMSVNMTDINKKE